MNIRRYLVISIFSLGLLLMGCSDKSKDKESESSAADTEEVEKETKESEELGDFNIHLGGEVTEEDDTFVVEGESNLLPGARIIGELIVKSADDKDEIFSNTSELIEGDGSFHMELEHHEYGEAEIVVRFDFEGVQDDEIRRHYGDKGQSLEGPFIYKHETYDGILNKAEAKITYSPNETNDLVFTTPDWNEVPDDYGDPRIWIEVDEITEDGEYFYLNGRSNILEGSEMRVSYRYNNSTTTVNPDGSFDFKFDYEYLEDEEMVIEFKPNYQWNEIEEAYGTTGQKLVGDLVEGNKHNTDEQYIEKHIQYDGNDVSNEENDNESNDKDDAEDKKD